MARIKGAMMTRKRRNKTLKLAKGYWGSKSKHFKMAKQAVMKSGQYAYIGRRQKKRDFRRLWITRISAAANLIYFPTLQPEKRSKVVFKLFAGHTVNFTKSSILDAPFIPTVPICNSI